MRNTEYIWRGELTVYTGAQVGGVNGVQYLEGLQVGLLDLASHVRGCQMGLVNVAGRLVSRSGL